MKEENYILKTVGTGNPFKVPEHYFEDFTQELIHKLPEKAPVLPTQEITLWQRVKPWIYMTAMFIGIMLSVRVFVGEPRKDNFPVISQTEADQLSEEDWEIIINHSMMDDYSLYQYLTDADYDIDN